MQPMGAAKAPRRSTRRFRSDQATDLNSLHIKFHELGRWLPSRASSSRLSIYFVPFISQERVYRKRSRKSSGQEGESGHARSPPPGHLIRFGKRLCKAGDDRHTRTG